VFTDGFTDRVLTTTVQFIPSGATTVVEIYAAVIGACMPTLVPVYRKVRYGDPLKTHTAALSKQTLPGMGSSAHRKQYRNEEGSFERLPSDNNFSSADYGHNHRVDISSGRKGYPSGDVEGESYQMDGVVVTQNTVWTEHKQIHSAV
jgi:hypothetical protein